MKFLLCLSDNDIDNICYSRNLVRDGVIIKPYLEKINHLLICFYTVTFRNKIISIINKNGTISL